MAQVIRIVRFSIQEGNGFGVKSLYDLFALANKGTYFELSGSWANVMP
jgi:hypothetical protein